MADTFREAVQRIHDESVENPQGMAAKGMLQLVLARLSRALDAPPAPSDQEGERAEARLSDDMWRIHQEGEWCGGSGFIIESPADPASGAVECPGCPDCQGER